ncbi:MAG: superinfection immunity protein [Nanoarchaeota archaeon]|nr:superinfection immunity protein [Nanoarchaeota archaeon]
MTNKSKNKNWFKKHPIISIILGVIVLGAIEVNFMDSEIIVSVIGFILAFILIFGIYLLPGIIAGFKKKKNQTAIFCFNFLLGWTIIGWIAALIWSLCED